MSKKQIICMLVCVVILVITVAILGLFLYNVKNTTCETKTFETMSLHQKLDNNLQRNDTQCDFIKLEDFVYKYETMLVHLNEHVYKMNKNLIKFNIKL